MAEHKHQYIKLPKDFIQNYMNTKNKKGLIIAYLFFHTTIDKEIYTSIDCMCCELQLSTKSHGERRNQNVVKDILLELIYENIVQFIPTEYCMKFGSISNSQLFKLKLNNQAEIFNPASKYVKIEKEEYDNIIKIKNNQLHRIFNIFYQIKSYVCMDNDCLHVCYPSIKKLCKLCGCSDNTLLNAIIMLCDNKLIYIYKLNDEERVIINRNIEYVFALEQYSKDCIMQEFAA